MSTKRLKVLRERLWKKDPRCYHCGKPTLLIKMDGGKLPDNGATIDHLFTKLDPERYQPPKPGERRLVLCCWKCNNDRAAQRNAMLSKEELWRRSGRLPRKFVPVFPENIKFSG